MKKLLFLSIILISLSSCKKKDYVTLEVNIKGLEAIDTTLTVYGNMIPKQIKVDENGTFKDTLKIIEGGYYGLAIGQKVQIQTFLRNGFDLKVTGDAKDIHKTLKFKGYGSENNNYLTERGNELTKFIDSQVDLMKKDSTEFNNSLKDFETKINKLLTDGKKKDTTLVKNEKDGLKGFLKNLKDTYKRNQAEAARLAKGVPSPKFVNYENFKGGKTSLDDFKGKFVYLFVWVTWDKPSVDEFEQLKQLEADYKGKNLQFVYISGDQKKDYDKWKEMVKEKAMNGIQLHNGEDLKFFSDYNISNIPRFILIDPNGNIVEANAPKATEKEAIRKLFKDAGIQ